MKKMQTNNKIFTKKYLNLASKKGVTLTSLIIYIAIMFIVLAIIMRLTLNFRKNLNDVADTTLQAYIEKLNIYMLEEAKKAGNDVVEHQQNSTTISFSDGNTFEFRDDDEDGKGEIYYSGTKLCKDVDNCTFSSTVNESGKTVISFEITVNSDVKQMSYVMKSNYDIATSTEGTYIVENGTMGDDVNTPEKALAIRNAVLTPLFSDKISIEFSMMDGTPYQFKYYISRIKDEYGSASDIGYNQNYTFNGLLAETKYYIKVQITDTNNHSITWNGETITGKVPDMSASFIDYTPQEATNQSVRFTKNSSNLDLTQYLNNGLTIKYQVDGEEDVYILDNNGYELEDNGSISFFFEDESGNQGNSYEITVDYIDKVAPVIYATIDSTTHSVTVNVDEVTDDNLPQTVYYKYYIKKIDEDEWEYINELREVTSYTFSNLDQDTEYTVKVEVQDSVGNIGVYQGPIATQEVPELVLDENITITANPLTFTNQSVTVTCEFNSQNYAGFTLMYQIEGSNEADEYNSSTGVVLTQNGNVEFFLVDDIGQEGDGVEYEVTWIDKDAPQIINVEPVQENVLTNVYIDLTDTTSSVEKIAIVTRSFGTPTPETFVNINNYTEVSKTDHTVRIQISNLNNAEAYFIWAMDVAGNMSETYYTYFTIDIDMDGEATLSTTEWTNQNVTAILPIKQDAATFTQYQVVQNGEVFDENDEWQVFIEDPIVIEQNSTIYYRYNFLNFVVGDYSTIEVTNIDKTNPTINKIGSSKADVTIEISDELNGSGLNKYAVMTVQGLYPPVSAWNEVENNILQIPLELNSKVYVYVSDNAGNVESQEITNNGYGLVITTTNKTTTAVTFNLASTNDVRLGDTFSWYVTEYEEGIENTGFLDDQNFTTHANPYNFNGGSDGAHYSVFVKDNNGNKGYLEFYFDKDDKLAPEITSVTTDYNKNNMQEITISVEDITGGQNAPSGLKEVKLYNSEDVQIISATRSSENAAFTIEKVSNLDSVSFNAETDILEIVLERTEGTVVYIQAEDFKNNKTSKTSVTFEGDHDNPIYEIQHYEYYVDGNNKHIVAFDLVLQDEKAGLSSYELKIDNATYKSKDNISASSIIKEETIHVEIENGKTLTITAQDRSINTNTLQQTVLYVQDNEGPTISFEEYEYSSLGTAVLTGTVTDNKSGVNTCSYIINDGEEIEFEDLETELEITVHYGDTVIINATDKFGNESVKQIVIIDNEKPSVIFNPNDNGYLGINDAFTVTGSITASDNETGVKKIEYVEVDNNGNRVNKTIEIAADGKVTVDDVLTEEVVESLFEYSIQNVRIAINTDIKVTDQEGNIKSIKHTPTKKDMNLSFINYNRVRINENTAAVCGDLSVTVDQDYGWYRIQYESIDSNGNKVTNSITHSNIPQSATSTFNTFSLENINIKFNSTIKVTDNTGNTKELRIQDIEKPTISLERWSINEENEFTIVVDCDDLTPIVSEQGIINVASSVHTFEYGNTTETFYGSSISRICSNYRLGTPVTVKDYAGNANLLIVQDTKKPIIEYDIKNIYTNSGTMEIEFTIYDSNEQSEEDNVEENVEEIVTGLRRVNLGNGEKSPNIESLHNETVIIPFGTTITATDKVGNTTTKTIIDSIAPKITFTPDTSLYNKGYQMISGTLHIEDVDENSNEDESIIEYVSGLKTVNYGTGTQNVSGVFEEWVTLYLGTTITATDAVGNTATLKVQDTLSPVIDYNIVNYNVNSNQLEIEFEIEDSQDASEDEDVMEIPSGLFKVNFGTGEKAPNSTEVHTETVTIPYEATVTAKDAMGNTASKTIVDRKPPVIDAQVTNFDKNSNLVTLNLHIVDDTSIDEEDDVDIVAVASGLNKVFFGETEQALTGSGEYQNTIALPIGTKITAIDNKGNQLINTIADITGPIITTDNEKYDVTNDRNFALCDLKVEDKFPIEDEKQEDRIDVVSGIDYIELLDENDNLILHLDYTEEESYFSNQNTFFVSKNNITNMFENGLEIGWQVVAYDNCGNESRITIGQSKEAHIKFTATDYEEVYDSFNIEGELEVTDTEAGIYKIEYANASGNNQTISSGFTSSDTKYKGNITVRANTYIKVTNKSGKEKLYRVEIERKKPDIVFTSLEYDGANGTVTGNLLITDTGTKLRQVEYTDANGVKHTITKDSENPEFIEGDSKLKIDNITLKTGTNIIAVDKAGNNNTILAGDSRKPTVEFIPSSFEKNGSTCEVTGIISAEDVKEKNDIFDSSGLYLITYYDENGNLNEITEFPNNTTYLSGNINIQINSTITVIDKAGNIYTLPNVARDLYAPTIQVEATQYNSTDDIEVQVTITDDFSGIYSYSISGATIGNIANSNNSSYGLVLNETVHVTDGTTITVNAEDMYGNVASTMQVVIGDSVGPIINTENYELETIDVGENAGEHYIKQYIVISDNQSGVNSNSISIEDNNNNNYTIQDLITGNNLISGYIEVPNNSQVTITVEDNFGNTRTKELTYSFNNNEFPVVVVVPNPQDAFINPQGWTTGNVTVTMVRNPNYILQYKIGDEEWQVYAAPFTVEENCVIEYRFYDTVNEKEGASKTLNINNIVRIPAPENGTIVPNVVWTSNNVNVVLVPDNEYTLQYKIDDNEWQTYVQAVEISQNCTVRYRLADLEKNLFGQEGSTINVNCIDKLQPTITCSDRNSTSVTLELRDDASGIKRYAVNTENVIPADNDLKWTIIGLEAGNTYYSITQQNLTLGQYYYAWVEDFAGNISESLRFTPQIRDIDGLDYSPKTITGGPVTITLPTTASLTTTYQIVNTGEEFDIDDTWTTYQNTFNITENCTIYYRYEFGVEAGQYNSFEITNIDTSGPIIDFAILIDGELHIEAREQNNIFGYAIKTQNVEPTLNEFTSYLVESNIINKKFTMQNLNLNPNTMYYIWFLDAGGNISPNGFAFKGINIVPQGPLVNNYTKPAINVTGYIQGLDGYLGNIVFDADSQSYGSEIPENTWIPNEVVQDQNGFSVTIPFNANMRIKFTAGNFTSQEFSVGIHFIDNTPPTINVIEQSIVSLQISVSDSKAGVLGYIVAEEDYNLATMEGVKAFYSIPGFDPSVMLSGDEEAIFAEILENEANIVASNTSSVITLEPNKNYVIIAYDALLNETTYEFNTNIPTPQGNVILSPSTVTSGNVTVTLPQPQNIITPSGIEINYLTVALVTYVHDVIDEYYFPEVKNGSVPFEVTDLCKIQYAYFYNLQLDEYGQAINDDYYYSNDFAEAYVLNIDRYPMRANVLSHTSYSVYFEANDTYSGDIEGHNFITANAAGYFITSNENYEPQPSDFIPWTNWTSTNNKKIVTNLENNTTYYIYVIDELGNISASPETFTTGVDKPFGGSVSPTTWIDEVTVTLPTKTLLTTEYQIVYENETFNVNGTWNTYNNSFTVNDNCVIYYRYNDGVVAGEPNTLNVANIDKTAPEIEITGLGMDNNLRFNIVDEGCGTKAYYIGRTTNISNATKYNASNGSQTATLLNNNTNYYIWGEDNLGNISSSYVTVTTGEFIQGDETLKLPQIDGYTTEYQIDIIEENEWLSYTSELSINENCTVFYRFKNNITNIATTNQSFTIDVYVENQNIYVYLYTDGTLSFGNTNERISGKSVSNTYGNIKDTNITTYSSVPWYNKRGSVKEVIFLNKVLPTNTNYWFYGCTNLTAINGINNLNTKNVTNMKYMFYNCSKLASLNRINRFNTKNVTDMSYMFYGCSSLTSLNLSGINMENVTVITSMFYGCSKLVTLDLSNLNLEKLTSFTLSNLGFNSSSALQTLNLSNLYIPNITTKSNFGGFGTVTKLQTLDLSNLNAPKLNGLGGFGTGIKNINLSYIYTPQVTDMNSLFSSKTALTTVNLSNVNLPNVTSAYSMFYGCTALTTVNLSNVNLPNVLSLESMFSNCSSLTSLDLSSFNVENVTNMMSMFHRCSKLPSLDLSNLNTENVTNMSNMFNGCSSLTSIDLSVINTENVTSAYNMFRYCSKLESVIGLNTSSVRDFSQMFDGCSSLTSLDLSNFNTENVTSNMSYMFNGCSSLTSLDLSNFNTENVTNMNYMFNGCSSLTSLNLSNFNTENVTNMNYMFNGCSSLTSLDLSSFNTANVTSMNSMFKTCSTLVTVYVSNNWSTAGLTANNSSSSMFTECNSIRGGNGTTYNSSYVDKTYARIDKAGQKGYFTLKTN